MSDTNLNQLIIETIRDVKGGVSKGVDFLLEQAPDVANQLLAYKFIEHLFYAVVPIVLFIALCLAMRWCYKHKRDWLYDESIAFPEPLGIFGSITLFIVFGITCVAAPLNTAQAIKIKVAPKLYLIEYCSTLVNGK